MMQRKISIQFCGGCNPRINRKQVAEAVSSALRDEGCLVFYNCPDADFIVFISGCRADCARRYNNARGPYLSVSGTAVDGMDIEKNQLVSTIINRVSDWFETGKSDVSAQNRDA